MINPSEISIEVLAIVNKSLTSFKCKFVSNIYFQNIYLENYLH